MTGMESRQGAFDALGHGIYVFGREPLRLNVTAVHARRGVSRSPGFSLCPHQLRSIGLVVTVSLELSLLLGATAVHD